MAVKFEQALLDYPQQRAGAARQPDSVDQSDRRVPINLRQSGPTPVEMLISTRVRKSPYWHLAYEAGCWRATVYNRMYPPRGYCPVSYTPATLPTSDHVKLPVERVA